MQKIYKLKINYNSGASLFKNGSYLIRESRLGFYHDENSYSGIPKEFISNNPDIFEECTEEYNLIQEAKRRYPKGTKFISKCLGTCISNGKFLVYSNCAYVQSENGGNVFDKRSGKWAEIVEDEKFKIGDKIFRIWPSGKKTLGIAAGYKNRMHHSESNFVLDPSSKLDVTHFFSLEDYDKEGGVCKNDGYGLCANNYKYELAKPLFTTEDGVDIFEGDEYWYVGDDFEGPEKHICNSTNIEGICFGKLFSTKEAAQKYIDSNKVKVEDGYLYANQKSFSILTIGSWDKSRFDFMHIKNKKFNEKWRHFVTKEARDKFIEENKPRFSKKDMIEFVSYFHRFRSDYIPTYNEIFNSYLANKSND